MILRGAILLAVGVLAAGCSQNKFWSTPLSFKRSSTDLAQDPANNTLPGSMESSAALSPDTSIRGPLALARLSERRGQPNQAERVYHAVIKKEPQNPVPYHRLGVIRARDGKFQEADEYFAKALERDPSNARLLSDVGYALYLEHRLEEAEEILRRALKIKPQDAAISSNLAIVLGEQGRDREALAMFRRTGTQAQAHANLAFVYMQQGAFEKAEANYSRALTLDPGLRPAAEALTQLADYEGLYEPSPTRRPTPPAGAGLAFEEPPLVEIVERPLAKIEELPPVESEERPLAEPKEDPSAESGELRLAEFREPPAMRLKARPLAEVKAKTVWPDAGRPQAVEPEAQQAAYLVDEPRFGLAAASDSAPAAGFEPAQRSTGWQSPLPAIAPEPAEESPDVWDRLSGAAEPR